MQCGTARRLPGACHESWSLSRWPRAGARHRPGAEFGPTFVMLRSKIFLITKRSFATSQHLTIGSIFSQTCQKNSSALSLISSHQRIRLDYGRLSSVCTAFASALLKLKYKRGDRIALALKNDAENLVTQLSCSMIGVSVVTAKDNDQLKQLSAELSCKGLIIDASNGVKHESDALVKDPLHPTIFTGHCGGINQSHLSFDELVKSPIISIPSDIPAEIPVAFYGTSSKSVNHLDLIKSAHAILMELRLGTWDRVCLPVTLNHTFGFGSGSNLCSSPTCGVCADRSN